MSRLQIIPGEPTPLIEYTASDREWTKGRQQILDAIRLCAARLAETAEPLRNTTPTVEPGRDDHTHEGERALPCVRISMPVLQKGDLVAEALGWSRGGFSTKVHLRAEGHGKPMTLILTPGQRHESTAFVALMQGGAVKRAGRGRPKKRPKRVSGDNGYSYAHIRQYLRQHGIRYTIPRRKDQHRGGPFDRTLYKLRNRVQRLINKLKHFRRLATRYEKRAENYRAMWVIGFILLWLRFADTT